MENHKKHHNEKDCKEHEPPVHTDGGIDDPGTGGDGDGGETHSCKPGQVWDSEQQRCVDDIG